MLNKFQTMLFLGCLVIVALVALGLYLFTSPIKLAETYEIRPWLLLFITGLAYIVFSFRFTNPIKAGEIGVRTFFAKPTDQLDAGLPFVPIGLFDITILDNLTKQDEWPTEPENIYRGNENETPPKGQKPPIRITFRSTTTEAEARALLGDYYDLVSKDYETGKDIVWSFQPHTPADGLNQRVTAEVTAVTMYRIVDGIKYVRTIGDRARAAKQLEDVVVPVLTRFLSLMSVAQALQNIEWISLILNNAVALRTASWGIELEKPKGAFVKSIGFHRELNEAIAAPSKADFTAKAVVRASEGDRNKIINVGEGTAQAAQDLAKGEIKGRAEGLEGLAGLLKVSGAEALAAETARAFGEAGNTAIIDPKTGLAGLVGLAGTLFNKKPPAGTTPTTPATGPTTNQGG